MIYGVYKVLMKYNQKKFTSINHILIKINTRINKFYAINNIMIYNMHHIVLNIYSVWYKNKAQLRLCFIFI